MFLRFFACQGPAGPLEVRHVEHSLKRLDDQLGEVELTGTWRWNSAAYRDCNSSTDSICVICVYYGDGASATGQAGHHRRAGVTIGCA